MNNDLFTSHVLLMNNYHVTSHVLPIPARPYNVYNVFTLS